MARFLGACSLALATVSFAVACGDGSAPCKWIGECPCNDGTQQEDGCYVAAETCDEACSGHGGVSLPDGGDGD